MKTSYLPIAGITLLQLVSARAALHRHAHEHLHQRDTVQVVDNVYVEVWKNAAGQVVSSSVTTIESGAAPPTPAPVANGDDGSRKLAKPQPAVASPSQPAPSSTTSSTPAASSTGSSGSSSGSNTSPGNYAGNGAGKGVAFNNQAQATQIGATKWGCNWAADHSGVNIGYEYVPQLWGQKNNDQGNWQSMWQSNPQAGKYALFYNEPDMGAGVGGSGIDVQQVIADFATYMQPLQKHGVKVSSPCVAANNTAYLETFLQGFPKGSVDVACFHYYGDADYLKNTAVPQFAKLARDNNVPELWLNEFAIQPAPPSLSDVSTFLDGAVNRYAYNMNDMEGSTGY